jgi:hypothetical protein
LISADPFSFALLMIRTPYTSNRPFDLGSYVQNHDGVPRDKKGPPGGKWGPQVPGVLLPLPH